MLCAAALLASLALSEARVWDYAADGGALPDDTSLSAAWQNGVALNATLNSLRPGDVLHIPNRTYHLMGGIVAHNLRSVVLRIDGTLVFTESIKEWPRNPHASGNSKHHEVFDCILLENSVNLTITSTGVGSLDGNGHVWWGIPGIGYLLRHENRPKLLTLRNSRDVLVERLRMVNSPYWTFWAENAEGLEVRHSSIDNRRTKHESHGLVDLTAFNTDGFDGERRVGGEVVAITHNLALTGPPQHTACADP